MSSLPELPVKPGTVAIKLKAAGERSVRSGHPWIFSDSIDKSNKPAVAGSIAVIFSRSKNKTIGVGLWDPDSPIRIKMLHNGPVRLDEEFLKDRIKVAYKKREPLLQTETNSYRLLFGENDGFPGLIVDVYAQVLVIKLYSAIWKPYLDWIIPELVKVSACETVVLRLSRKLQAAKDGFRDGMIVHGELKDEVVPFLEHGVLFTANVIKGHKTGYFLDHRANRKRVGESAAAKRVLDVFSYAGGFSVHALAGGATEVTSVDISTQALEVAKSNAQLQNAAGIHQTIAGDAFVIMEQLIQDELKFDLVVIDPPSFAKKGSEVALAKKKYAQLASLGVRLVDRNGMLVLASCSSRVSLQAFLDVNQAALEQNGRPFKRIEVTQHDIDHPIGFPEGAYLKCAYYQFLD